MWRHPILIESLRRPAGAIALSFALAACTTVSVAPPAVIAPTAVVAMSKQGTPPADIVQRLKASGTVYTLSASSLVELHRQGVPPEVLDYMQQTYLEDVRRQENLRRWPSADPFCSPFMYRWPYGYW